MENNNKIIYPTLEEYLGNLDELSKIDFKDCSYDGIYNKFFDLALTIQSLGAYLVAEKINGRKIYRARLAKHINVNEDLSLIKTYSYPPSNFCSNNGRANVKFKSVFYCSDNFYSAIKEINATEQDELYLSVWEFQTKRDLKYVSYLPVDLPNNNYWRDIVGFHIDYLKNNNQENIGLSCKLALRNFITDRFIMEESPYPLTSMIANENMYYENADLLIYPSVKVFQDYVNYALHPNVADKHIVIKKVFHLKGIKFFKENTKIEVLRVGEIDDDRIIWRATVDFDKKDLGLF